MSSNLKLFMNTTYELKNKFYIGIAHHVHNLAEIRAGTQK